MHSRIPPSRFGIPVLRIADGILMSGPKPC